MNGWMRRNYYFWSNAQRVSFGKSHSRANEKHISTAQDAGRLCTCPGWNSPTAVKLYKVLSLVIYLAYLG